MYLKQRNQESGCGLKKGSDEGAGLEDAEMILYNFH